MWPPQASEPVLLFLAADAVKPAVGHAAAARLVGKDLALPPPRWPTHTHKKHTLDRRWFPFCLLLPEPGKTQSGMRQHRGRMQPSPPSGRGCTEWAPPSVGRGSSKVPVVQLCLTNKFLMVGNIWTEGQWTVAERSSADWGNQTFPLSVTFFLTSPPPTPILYVPSVLRLSPRLHFPVPSTLGSFANGHPFAQLISSSPPLRDHLSSPVVAAWSRMHYKTEGGVQMCESIRNVASSVWVCECARMPCVVLICTGRCVFASVKLWGLQVDWKTTTCRSLMWCNKRLGYKGLTCFYCLQNIWRNLDFWIMFIWQVA